MSNADPAMTPFAITCRWLGRLSAGLLCGMVIAHLIGADLPYGFRARPTETLQLTAFLVVVMGLVVGWLWEGAGALMIMGGMTAYTVLIYQATGLLPGAPTFFFWIPGLLYLACAALSSRAKVSAAA